MVDPRKLQALDDFGWALIWNICWQGEYFDFTQDAWVNLQHSQQFKYARAYQAWYAKTKGMELDKVVEQSGAKFEFQLIPPGKFWMGSPVEEVGYFSGETSHRVLISKPFYIGKYAVTQAQWLAVVSGDNPASFKDGESFPVEYVSWEMCQDFCQKAGMTLPTEAQWEYACRAGTTTPFNLGENITPVQVNYDGNYPYNNAAKGESRIKTVPVGSLPNQNAWGCFDFHGNVCE
jgi:formylglycine-generating enzyme required for sulfatase activity